MVYFIFCNGTIFDTESTKITLIMKQIYLAFFIFAALMTIVPNIEMSAQTIRNSSYTMIGQIDSDGTIRNSSYSMIGRIDRDGTIRNSSYTMVGKIDSDGTIRNSSYTMIGKVEKDGTIRNSSYSMIGKIDDDGTVRNSSYSSIGTTKGIKKEWAAIWFFFPDMIN